MRGINKGLSGPTKTRKRSKERKSEGANRSEHRKTPKTNLQIYTEQHINFADKKGKKKKNNKGKTQNTGKELTQDKFKRKTKEREQKQSKNGKAAEQKTKQEKSNEHSTTVCDHKSSTSQKKTQGKRQTLKIKYSQRKTYLQQITSKTKQATASQTTCTKQQRKSHKTATHFPITKAKRTVNTQEENATSTNNVFKSA